MRNHAGPRAQRLAAGARLGVGALLTATAALVGAACGGGDAGVASARIPSGSHGEAVEHEACNESSGRVEVLDANGDGKADIKRVYNTSTGKEICRIADLNHDGKADMFEYFDANGDVRRREADYDDSGVVDAIEFFERGKIVRRELDTTGQHRIDTWDFFDGSSGKRLRRERDTTNDGRVDQWWTWDGDKVTIAYDRDGDGKPDPNDTLVMGEGSAPKAQDAGPPSTASAMGVADAGLASSAQPSAAGSSAPLLKDSTTAPAASATKPSAPATTKPAGKPLKDGAKK